MCFVSVLVEIVVRTQSLDSNHNNNSFRFTDMYIVKYAHIHTQHVHSVALAQNCHRVLQAKANKAE